MEGNYFGALSERLDRATGIILTGNEPTRSLFRYIRRTLFEPNRPGALEGGEDHLNWGMIHFIAIEQPQKRERDVELLRRSGLPMLQLRTMRELNACYEAWGWSNSAARCSSCLLLSGSLPPGSIPPRYRAISAPTPPLTSPGEDPGPIAPRHSSGAIHGPGSTPGKCGGWERYQADGVSRLPRPTEARRLENEIKPASLPPPCGEGTGVRVATRANACGFIPEATSAPTLPHERKGVQSNCRTTKRARGTVGTAHP